MGTPNRPVPTVVVGVGAGIAAYKVAYAVRGLKKLGMTVHVIPTPASLNFVGQDTWSELSENPAPSDIFGAGALGHVELARRADLIVLAPATADLLARARAGQADDLLTATILASRAPVIAFPAMHTAMWENPATADNICTLRARGWSVVEPAEGALSSGDEGKGRMVEPEVIVEVVRDHFHSQAAGCLAGKRLVISAGGTQEPIDPVRYLGNRSSGKMGVELASEAARRGADVTLIAANVTVPLPKGARITVVDAPSAAQMLQAVVGAVGDADALIMAAAVADFTPTFPADSKIKKAGPGAGLNLELTQTTDILKAVTAGKPEAVVIGFGAETGSEGEVLEKGRDKALYKEADLLAVNRVGGGEGFGDVDSKLTFFDASGEVVGSATGDKPALARALLDRLCALIEESS